MKCVIDGKIVECEVIEDLGFQNGVPLKKVLYNNMVIVVPEYDPKRIVHYPDYTLPSGFTDPMC